jgi:hypothetical protein
MLTAQAKPSADRHVCPLPVRDEISRRQRDSPGTGVLFLAHRSPHRCVLKSKVL